MHHTIENNGLLFIVYKRFSGYIERILFLFREPNNVEGVMKKSKLYFLTVQDNLSAYIDGPISL
jgi:hypothetical protein